MALSHVYLSYIVHHDAVTLLALCAGLDSHHLTPQVPSGVKLDNPTAKDQADSCSYIFTLLIPVFVNRLHTYSDL